VCVSSKSWHSIKINVLDFGNVNCILLELRKYFCHSILEPEGISFEFNTLEKRLVMLDSMTKFPTRFCPFSVYCIDHIVWAFIAKSHTKYRLLIIIISEL
jgi:hypothetical protein